MAVRFSTALYFLKLFFTGIFRIWKIVNPSKCLCYFWRTTRKIYVFLNLTISLFILFKFYKMTVWNISFSTALYFLKLFFTGIFRIWKIVNPSKCLCYFWRTTRKIYVFLNLTISLFILYKFYKMTVWNILFYSFIKFIVNITRIFKT